MKLKSRLSGMWTLCLIHPPEMELPASGAREDSHLQDELFFPFKTSKFFFLLMVHAPGITTTFSLAAHVSIFI